jgi:hypothetical protein
MKASPEIQHKLSSEFTPKGLIITNRSFCHNDVVQSTQNSGNQLSGKREHHGRPAMMPSVVVFHPLQLSAGQDLSEPHITESIT